MQREPGPFPRFWWDENPGFCGALLRSALAPAGRAYAAVQRSRARAYAAGRARVHRPPVPCVSVGNLTVGGSGKTPCVRFVAERLLALGKRPLVLSRGYGAKVPGSDLDEEGASLVMAVPGITVDQTYGRREGRGDWSASFAGPSSVVVLDDGFQKLVAARDLDLLLLDASRPFGNGRCLPAGPMREPPEAAARAHLIVLTRCDLAGPVRTAALQERVGTLAPGVPQLRSRHAPSTLVRSGLPATSLRGRKVALLSAIAHPAAFAATVRGLGAEIVSHDARRDHAPLGPKVLLHALRDARAAGAELLLCTLKDLPKLPAPDAEGPVAFDALDVLLEFMDDPAPLIRALHELPYDRGGR